MEERAGRRAEAARQVVTGLWAVILFCGFGTNVSSNLTLPSGGPIGTNSQVELGWNPSPDPAVSGYRLYVGLASRSYSAVYDVGMATNFTVSGLMSGTIYYFAATDYATNGLESDFSAEISFTNAPVASNTPPQITVLNKTADGNFSIGGTAAAGQTYVLVGATNFNPPVTWVPVATNTADAQGSLSLVDLEATNFPQRFYRIEPAW